jgi:hypothetical protein
MRRSNFNTLDNWIENIGVPVSLFQTAFGNVKFSLANSIAPTYLEWSGKF